MGARNYHHFHRTTRALLTLVAFLVVIGVLIFVHELGHLVAAKAVDIEVPRFSIGFGPRIAGFTRGETEYVISALPLGGYVRMAGMEDTSALEGGADEEHVPSPRDFDAKPLWARALVISAGVAMNFLFAIVVLAGVALFLGEPLNPTTRVAIVGEPTGASAPLASIPLGADLQAVDGETVETWNDVANALEAAPAGPTTLTFADGSAVELTLPAGDSARVAMLQPLQPFTEPVIGEVTAGSPAAQGGIEPGDRVVTADGGVVETWNEFVDIVRDRPGEPLELVVERDGRQVALTPVAGTERELNVEMERVEIGRLGVAPEQQLVFRRMGLLAAADYGITTTWNTSAMIVALVGDLLTGQESMRSLGGPLAIGQLSGQAARYGLEMFLQWMALLSVNLAVLNLLPIPVLDGGQLLFIGVEAVRGRPLSIEQRLRLSHVGLIIVVGIMVWAITNDFLRFFGI
ncbi:MAG: RIP metalloprotease RseP [Gemmatimonas sp.]|nr:RIP metalloprotease RseP [Gemmatimonas sp.]